jgi:Zn finger protein HypA/HybF involved in hydrogenase expression
MSVLARTRRRSPDGGWGRLRGGAASDRGADREHLDAAHSTLGCLIEQTLAQLEEHSAARCPVCGGTMLRAVGVRGGKCTRCRTSLG